MIMSAYQQHVYGPSAAEMTSRKLVGNAGRIDRQPYYLPEMPNYSKIIFLNKENLSELEGYKASIELYGGLMGKQEVHIILTGFSIDSAKALFDKLKALPQHEIYSDNTSTLKPIKSSNGGQ